MRNFGLVLLVLQTALIHLGCSAPDPGAFIDTGPRRAINGAVAPGGGSNTPDPNVGTGGGGADGGPVTVRNDGGTPDAGVTVQGLFAAAYAPGKPAQSANAAHNGKAGAPAQGQTGRGTNCLQCHVAGGAAAGKLFMFGGTVFSDAAGTVAAVDAEVGVQLPNGTRIKVNSDDNGNFWLPDVQALPAASKTAARTAATLRPMVSPPTGACNLAGCHGPGATALRAQ